MSRCIAMIQARMSSSRFPGKVLAELGGRPMIEFMVGRARRARLLDEVVVVTSVDPSDDPLNAALLQAGIPCLRGDLEDVLGRYVAAAVAFPSDEIVRLTGDCPLIDPAVIDAVIGARRDSAVPYASNVDPPTFPDGLDVECFTRDALMQAHGRARPGPQREHVTLWMRSDEARLPRANLRAPADLSHLRLTVDYPDDLAAVSRLLTELQEPADAADLYDILRVLGRHPEITQINLHARNEGLQRSLSEAARTTSADTPPSETGVSP